MEPLSPKAESSWFAATNWNSMFREAGDRVQVLNLPSRVAIASLTLSTLAASFKLV